MDITQAVQLLMPLKPQSLPASQQYMLHMPPTQFRIPNKRP